MYKAATGGRAKQSMHVEDSGLVFDAARQPATQRVASFVSLCALESGSLLCGFQLGSCKHAVDSTLCFCRSRDGGSTWQRLAAEFESTIDGMPGSLATGEVVEVYPGRLLLMASWFDRSDPERPLFDPETQGILHGKQLRAFSTDEGKSWSRWEELPTPGLIGCSGTGPLLKWPDGTIAFAFESFCCLPCSETRDAKLEREYDDDRPRSHGAWLAVSRDGGRAFAAPLRWETVEFS